MRRDHVGLWSPAIGAEGGLLAYGHHGHPLLVFQSEQGRCSDYEDRGMIDAIADLIEAGRVKVYSVDSYDADSWCDPDLPLEARAVRHGKFEDWVLNQVVPFGAVVLILFAFYYLLPLYVMLVNSLKPLDEIRQGDMLSLPQQLTFDP